MGRERRSGQKGVRFSLKFVLLSLPRPLLSFSSATLFSLAVVASVSPSGFLFFFFRPELRTRHKGGKDMTAWLGATSAAEQNNHLHIIRWKAFQGNPSAAPQTEEAKKKVQVCRLFLRISFSDAYS